MAGVSHDDDEISGINVTPLVDVVLVLLVIFMITAPALYQNALKVHLPKAKSSEEQVKAALEISMDEMGAITMKGKTLSLEELQAQVRRDHTEAVVLLADKKVEHGKVISVIDTLKLSGVSKFSFGVEKN